LREFEPLAKKLCQYNPTTSHCYTGFGGLNSIIMQGLIVGHTLIPL
jgi:hypothetical protein